MYLLVCQIAGNVLYIQHHLSCTLQSVVKGTYTNRTAQHDHMEQNGTTKALCQQERICLSEEEQKGDTCIYHSYLMIVPMVSSSSNMLSHLYIGVSTTRVFIAQ